MLEVTPSSAQSPGVTSPSPFHVSDQLSVEDSLVHASELLRCAAATAFENGDRLTGTSRDLAFSVLHLVQMASAMVDKSLDRFTRR
ncbi:DUF6124 family protein [Pseudomonas sp. DWP3-1-2]|jgi:hypothetical protein|uniref:DUF6124 family protein n=1 Tax=Pseudomonas sp. DWP3-1-2 TaxID=2804645 RepID=UPI003CF4376B